MGGMGSGRHARHRWPASQNHRPLSACLIAPYNCAAIFYRDANRGDAVGYYQGLADVLEKAQVITNDKFITQWDGSRLLVDRENPRVELVLTEVAA
jgi:hypothetical protein